LPFPPAAATRRIPPSGTKEAQKAIQEGMQKEKALYEGMQKNVETLEKKVEEQTKKK